MDPNQPALFELPVLPLTAGGLPTLARTWSNSAQGNNTIRARADDLARWGLALHAKTHNTPFDVTAGLDLERAWQHIDRAALNPNTLVDASNLLRHSYSPATSRRALSTIRGFCRWLTRQGFLPGDPTADHRLDVGTAAKPEHRSFGTEEIHKLLTAAGTHNPQIRSRWAVRDVATIAVLAGCGLRAEELVNLRTDDLHLNDPEPHLTTERSNRRRQVPVPDEVATALRAWLTARTNRPQATSPILFIRPDGKPLDRPFLDRLIRQLATEANVRLPGAASVTALRNHYGVTLAEQGLTPSEIATLMGNSDKRSGAAYTGHARTITYPTAGWA